MESLSDKKSEWGKLMSFLESGTHLWQKLVLNIRDARLMGIESGSPKKTDEKKTNPNRTPEGKGSTKFPGFVSNGEKYHCYG